MVRIDSLADYYAVPDVRRRIREYCGGSDERPPTCMYVAAVGSEDGPFVTWEQTRRYPVNQLDALLRSGADIARSTWDTADLLIHLDIDYLNIDARGEAFDHPAEVFFKLEPVYRATQHVLRRFGLPLFPLMTGQGYHFTGRVPLESAVVDRIAALLPEVPGWVERTAVRRPPWISREIPPRHARAYVGAGMLGEFLAHAILRRARRRSPIPIVLNGTVVGSGLIGRECVSLDISYAGDPLDVRHQRVAFGAYQKHRFRPDIVGPRVASGRAPFIAVPRGRESLAHLLSHGRELRHAARAARAYSAVLPTVTGGVARLTAAYETSTLGACHRAFYAAPPWRVDELGVVFGRLALKRLPDCVRHPLTAPNDLLLQPAVIQHVTRWLMADGMPPREIAAIVHSRYAADFEWQGRWNRLDARTRAEFDVRVFAAMLATGIDETMDFNCRSAQEKGLCPDKGCGRDLRVDRERLHKTVHP
jgi:hypothetical protein